MHTIIPVENVAYKIIFHTVDAFQIWNDQLVHPMGLVEKIISNSIGHIFLKVWLRQVLQIDFKTLLS